MHFSSPFQQKCKTVKYLFSLWGSRSLRDRQSQFPFNTPLPIVFIYTNYRPISNPNPHKISIIDIPKCKNTHTRYIKTEANINLCKIYCTGHTFVLPYQEQDARRVYDSDNLTSTPALYLPWTKKYDGTQSKMYLANHCPTLWFLALKWKLQRRLHGFDSKINSSLTNHSVWISIHKIHLPLNPLQVPGSFSRFNNTQNSQTKVVDL